MYTLNSLHFSICNYSSRSLFSSHTFVIYFYTLRLMIIIVSLTIHVHAISCIRHRVLCRRWPYQNNALFTQNHRTENNNDNVTCFITVYQDYIYIKANIILNIINVIFVKLVVLIFDLEINNNVLKNKSLIDAMLTCKEKHHGHQKLMKCSLIRLYPCTGWQPFPPSLLTLCRNPESWGGHNEDI